MTRLFHYGGVYVVPLLCCFLQEIDAFVQEFLSVVQRLPSSISVLQALSKQPQPATFSQLQHFCSANEAKFLQLRRSDSQLHICFHLQTSYGSRGQCLVLPAADHCIGLKLVG